MARLLPLLLLAIAVRAPAAPAPEALRAAAVLAAARAAGVTHPGDCRAWLAWATYPGRDPAALADPARPAPLPADRPPRVRLLGGDAGLTRFARGLTGRGDVAVRTVPRAGASAFDRPTRTVLLAADADLADLLHELGHAAAGSDELSDYERTYKDFRHCRAPEDSALLRDEAEADAAFGAGILSAGRASRSYRRGIAAAISANANPNP